VVLASWKEISSFWPHQADLMRSKRQKFCNFTSPLRNKITALLAGPMSKSVPFLGKRKGGGGGLLLTICPPDKNIYLRLREKNWVAGVRFCSQRNELKGEQLVGGSVTQCRSLIDGMTPQKWFRGVFVRDPDISSRGLTDCLSCCFSLYDLEGI